MKKLNLGLLFGGRSCEHEVSVTSARSILNAIDLDKYNVCLIGIDKSGHWHLADDFDALISDGAVKFSNHHLTGSVAGSVAAPANALDSAGTGHDKGSDDLITLDLHNQGNLAAARNPARHISPPALDVIFPVLHGTFGEDGTLQGVFEMAGIPYVGCGVAASALAMDKALAKKIFQAAGIPQATYTGFTAREWKRDPGKIMDQSEFRLGYPVFVKPANLGSSVGISKAHGRDQLKTAIELAFDFDNKIVIEQSMENCLEVECAVLGNHDPQASVVGEINPGAEFYDYTTKYIDDKSELTVPANLPDEATSRVRELSIAAFKAIDGAGLARVDFFVHKDTWQVILNEVNTLPGFTPISMYPRLWAASGVSYSELIDRLIELALEIHQSKATLQRAFELP